MTPGVLRTPDERFAGLHGYDFAPHYVELTGDLDGLRMHHVDEGEGDPILLLHGEPSWSYLYRKMIGPLADLGRVLAPDLLGFGRSDKPTTPDWYSFSRHVDSIVQLIEALDLRRVTMVVHDWGGPIGLRIATSDPERVARLVILNTGLYRPGGNWPAPAWLAFRDFVAATPDFPVGDMMQAGTLSHLPAEVVAGYEAPFSGLEAKAGAVAFPQMMPLGEASPGAAEMYAARLALDSWHGPTLVCFSDSDPLFPPRSGERWAERIPGADPFVLIEEASHFLQEDKGEEVAGAIASFIARHPLDTGVS